MKILMITPHLPAPTTCQAGERLVFETIKLLSQMHEIHLVVRLEDKQRKELEFVKKYCKEVYPVFYKRPVKRNLFTIPIVVHSYYKLCNKANELALKDVFDVMHVEWTETGFFLKKNNKMGIEAHDIVTKPMERKYNNSEGIKRIVNYFLYKIAKQIELHIYKKFNIIFVYSEYDKDYLLSMHPFRSVSTLMHPPGLSESNRAFDREKNSLLFLGAMDRGPNIEAVLYFCNKILPLIKKEIPDIKFLIVGSRPLPEVVELASKDKNIIVTGFVKETESYYKQATIFVAPLLTGGGIIIKIIDALSAGIPVVTTSIGNEGICAVAGEQIMIGDNPGVFAANVISLLKNEKLRNRLGTAGQEFVRKNYTYENWKRQLTEGYEQLGAIS